MIAYRLAEHEKILLPAIVNLDGFYLSFTREPVAVPTFEEVKGFLPSFRPAYPVLSGKESVALGAAVLDASLYSYFKHQMHNAAENALAIYPQIAAEFAERFGRRHDMVEEFMLDDADYVFVMTNSFASMGKAEIKRLRDRGKESRLGAAANDSTLPARRDSTRCSPGARVSRSSIRISPSVKAASCLVRSPARFTA